jgi:hypothetical protein
MQRSAGTQVHRGKPATGRNALRVLGATENEDRLAGNDLTGEAHGAFRFYREQHHEYSSYTKGSTRVLDG